MYHKIKKAWKNRKPQKYRRRIERLVDAYFPSEGYGEDVRAESREMAWEVLRSVGRKNREDAMRAMEQLTVNPVYMTVKHINMSRKAMPLAMTMMRRKVDTRDERNKSIKAVLGTLDHEKTTSKNPHVFLEMAAKHGYARTRAAMNREGIDERNIGEYLEGKISRADLNESKVKTIKAKRPTPNMGDYQRIQMDG